VRRFRVEIDVVILHAVPDHPALRAHLQQELSNLVLSTATAERSMSLLPSHGPLLLTGVADEGNTIARRDWLTREITSRSTPRCLLRDAPLTTCVARAARWRRGEGSESAPDRLRTRDMVPVRDLVDCRDLVGECEPRGRAKDGEPPGAEAGARPGSITAPHVNDAVGAPPLRTAVTIARGGQPWRRRSSSRRVATSALASSASPTCSRLPRAGSAIGRRPRCSSPGTSRTTDSHPAAATPAP
jgi:hypothetical protein